jgi:hypothetical protein
MKVGDFLPRILNSDSHLGQIVLRYATTLIGATRLLSFPIGEWVQLVNCRLVNRRWDIWAISIAGVQLHI